MENAINGYFKLSWRERIGFCSGYLAVSVGRHLMPLLKDGAEAVAQRIDGMTAELAGVMARTGVSSLDKMDSTVIHRRTF